MPVADYVLMRRVLEVAVLLAVSALVSCHLYRLAHEIVGHLGTAWLFGGEVRGFTLYSGAATSSYRLPADAGATAKLVTSAGGLVVQIATGLAAFHVARRLRTRRRRLALVALVYATVSLASAASYVALGLYHEWGDAVGIVAAFVGQDDAAFWSIPLRVRAWWVPFALATPLVVYACAREYARQQTEHRFVILGSALALFFALRIVEQRVLPVWGTPMESPEHGERLAQRRAIATRATVVGWARANAELRGRRFAPESPPPLAVVLLVMQAIAVVAGARTRRTDVEANRLTGPSVGSTRSVCESR